MTTTINETTVPVTVLTGFLGSGKTTLLNRILTENHGKRIAVIENEFGEVGVDQELVIGADEEVFEMNNGCICCTVRGDLIRILGTLMKRKDKFDYILVETTGLADPGPVAQTFFVDQDVRSKTRLDGIVTLVDALHFGQHLDESTELKEQIAFADVILLNKIDLVGAKELDDLEARIRSMNGAAKIFRTTDAAIPMERILDVGGFDLDRALDVRPAFLEPEYPFEWAGAYQLEPGTYDLRFAAGPDPAMDLVVLSAGSVATTEVGAVVDQATLAFSGPPMERHTMDRIQPGENLWRIALNPAKATIVRITFDAPGAYVLFTQHGGLEYDVALIAPDGATVAPAQTIAYKPNHSHDATVTSVGIETEGDCVEARLDVFFRNVLQKLGPDIFRMKGVLSIENSPRRFIFQGVHMLFDGRPDREWGREPRRNMLVFIGRNLNREQLNADFRACLAS
jgi:G3E family GTPase